MSLLRPRIHIRRPAILDEPADTYEQLVRRTTTRLDWCDGLLTRLARVETNNKPRH